MILYNYTVWGRGHFPAAKLHHDNRWLGLEAEAGKMPAHAVERLGEGKVHTQGIKPSTRELWASSDWEGLGKVQQIQV